MRFEKYINEKYMNTVTQKYDGKPYEVFVNPSKKELLELSLNDADGRFIGGYRYLIDFKNKQFYAFSLSMFHATLFGNIPTLPKWNDFWQRGEGLEWIYTGHVDGKVHDSDGINRFGREKIVFGKQLKELQNQDWRWASRFMDTNFPLQILKKYTSHV